MKTVLKPNAATDARFYRIWDLENESELSELIKEARLSLLPCAQCGREHPHIDYMYLPKENNPHVFFVNCVARSNDENVTFGCGMRSCEWRADDDDVENEDIKDALAIICRCWNNRPDK